MDSKVQWCKTPVYTHIGPSEGIKNTSEQTINLYQGRPYRYLRDSWKESGYDVAFIWNVYRKYLQKVCIMRYFHINHWKYLLKVIVVPLPGRNICLLGYNSSKSCGVHVTDRWCWVSMSFWNRLQPQFGTLRSPFNRAQRLNEPCSHHKLPTETMPKSAI